MSHLEKWVPFKIDKLAKFRDITVILYFLYEFRNALVVHPRIYHVRNYF